MGARTLGVIALCGSVAFILAGMIVTGSGASDSHESDILVRLFGGTAEIASQTAMDQADLYLHAGVGHTCDDCRHAEEERALPLPLYAVVTRLHGETAPKEHKHVQGAEEKELLPWFIVAARLNPHNVEAWLDGTYWFYRTGETQEAERFITEAIAHNPDDHRVYLERGILYHRLKRYPDAARDLETSIELYKTLSDESPFELKAARIYLRDTRKHLSNQ